MPIGDGRAQLEPTDSALLESDGLVRAAHLGESRNLLRVGVTAAVAVFMGTYVSLAAGAVWLGASLGVEGVGFFARARLRAGDFRFRGLSLGTVGATSCLWVVHALALWDTGQHVAQIAALIDLFSICLYAAIGTLVDARITWSLMGAPLATLCFVLVRALWREASPLMAAFGTLASIGACAIIAINALALASLHRRLDAALRKAAAANAAKDVFLSNMSHELRTPLNGVVGLASTLKRTRLSARQAEMVDLILSSSQTLNRLLSDILDAAKLTAGKMVLQHSLLNLDAVIGSAARLHGGAAAEKGVDLVIDTDKSARGWFYGDETRLSQIVSNLVSNAVKFTDAGRIVVRTRVEQATEHAAQLVIEVADTGQGFDDGHADQLFERFEQGQAPPGGASGTGLGLAICRSLAESMGGSVTARSTPGIGSAFSVTLVLEPAPAPPATVAPDGILEAAPGSVRVLVADDHDINRRTIGFMLSAIGVDAVIVRDGQEALTAAGETRFDAILMDMQMPGLNGLAATAAIREDERRRQRPRTPIIMVSAHAEDRHVDAALSADCDLYLAKPLAASDLIEALRTVTEDRRAA